MNLELEIREWLLMDRGKIVMKKDYYCYNTN